MNRTIAIVAAAVVILAGAGYFIFSGGLGGGDRVTGEELRAYVETQFGDTGATFESVTYDEGSDTVTVTGLDWGNTIPLYKEFRIATLEIKGGDKRALELLFDEAAAKEAEGGKFRRVAKKVTAENITVSLDMASFAKMYGAEVKANLDKAFGDFNAVVSVESSSVEDFAVKSTGKPWSALLQMPDMSSPAAANNFLALAGEFGAALKYGPNETKGLTYRLEAEEFSLETNLESMSSEGYDGGVVGKTEMGPLTAVMDGEAIREELGGAITASVDSATVERIDMAGMLTAMQNGTMMPENPKKAPILSAWSPTFGDYRVSDVKVSVPELGDFTLEEFSAKDVKHVAGLALGGKGELKNLVIPASALQGSGAQPVLEGLGAEELRINISSAATYNDKDKVWDVSKFLIDVDKFGSLNTQFRFGGLGFLNDLVGMPADEFASSGMMNRALQEMTFEHLQLTYRDQGAVNYLLDSMAEQSGLERSQLVQQYVQQFDAMRAQFGEAPALNDLSKALTSFLQEPESLTLTFNPDEPVPLAQLSAVGMAAPAQLIETLGFSAKANQ